MQVPLLLHEPIWPVSGMHVTFHEEKVCHTFFGSQDSFSEIARLLTDFFRDLDLVPTDIVAGLVLLRKQQKKLQETQVRQVSRSSISKTRVSFNYSWIFNLTAARWNLRIFVWRSCDAPDSFSVFERSWSTGSLSIDCSLHEVCFGGLWMAHVLIRTFDHRTMSSLFQNEVYI